MYSSIFSAILFAASLLAILLMVASKKRKADAGLRDWLLGRKRMMSNNQQHLLLCLREPSPSNGCKNLL
jgi:hypothetical protein